MLQVHAFKTGESIKAYTESPEYGRIIVATNSSELTTDASGGTWFRETTRVAFIKGKVAQLTERFGKLAKGDTFNADFTVIKKESTTPFYMKADGTPQDPKIKPSYTAKDGTVVPEEVILHNGAPVYMQFEIAPNGTADQLVEAETVVIDHVEEDIARA